MSHERHRLDRLIDDERYNRATRQVVDIYIDNIDTEDILSDRNDLTGKLVNSVRKAFQGREVYPYVLGIQPSFQVPLGKEHLLGSQETGSLVSVGTQRAFHMNVYKLVHHLQLNTTFCSKRLMVVLNKYFYPTFHINWCRIRIRNVTSQHDLNSQHELKRMESVALNVDEITIRKQQNSEIGTTSEEYTFWESVLVFPLIAVLCILLVLILSFIFFGRREGQHWRDYKTTKEQMDGYVSVRQSQRHLRELSVQRQLLLMARGLHQPSGCDVHSFLQPMCKGAKSDNDPSQKFIRSGGKFEEDNGENTELLSISEPVPVGKQTVAEAAQQCESSLHLYRNPLEGETEEENDNDSLDEKL